MKIKIAKQELVDSISRLQNVVNAQTPAILTNVLLVAAENGLSLTGSDMEVRIETEAEAESSENGATTLPAKRLLAIAKALPGDSVEMTTDSKNITTIKSGGSVFKVYGIGKDDYPSFLSGDVKQSFVASGSDLAFAIRNTQYAISTDTSRYVLNGILFSLNAGSLTLVATDGRRLALKGIAAKISGVVAAGNRRDAIIPAKGISELARLLEDADVTVNIGDNFASFVIGRTTLITKLVDGTYPDYRQVIPLQSKHQIKLDRDALLQTINA